jgi:hypothetical protein
MKARGCSTTILPPVKMCPLTRESPKPEHTRTAREGAKYDVLPETAWIKVANGYVTFSLKFKYLRLQILYNL